MSDVWSAAGGAVDARGTPTTKGSSYNPTLANDAMDVVKKQYKAATSKPADTIYTGGLTFINAPSTKELSKAISAAENQVGVVWEGEIGYPVADNLNDPQVQAAIAQSMCKSHPAWCVQLSAGMPSFMDMIKQLLPLLIGGIDDGAGEGDFDPVAVGSKLPEFIPGRSSTSGVGVGGNGRTYDVISGNKNADASLIKIVNDKLRSEGVLTGTANSSRASDAEQKFAAIMIRDGIGDAQLVINNPQGPCTVKLGCDNVLDKLLGSKKLTVYYPNGNGGWIPKKYGGN